MAFGRHYGLTIATCVPADPASKGGVGERGEDRQGRPGADARRTCCPSTTVFAELEAACAAFCEQVNARVHRVTRRVPAEMLAEERARLHPLPEHPYTAAFGVTRTVPVNTPMVAFEHGQYSVPHTLAGQTVWVRRHGEQVVIVHVGDDGPVEVARHAADHAGQPAGRRRAFPAATGGAAGPDSTPEDRRRGTSSWRSVTGRRCG